MKLKAKNQTQTLDLRNLKKLQSRSKNSKNLNLIVRCSWWLMMI